MEQRQRPDGRSRLVEATLSCLADYGHHGTTLRRIAQRAEVTAGLVRHHFESKEQLLVAAYRAINQAALERMAAAQTSNLADGEGALEASVRAFFPADPNDPRQMRIMVAFWGLVLTKAEIAEVQQATYTAFHAHFAAIVERLIGPGRDVGEIAKGIIAIADGLWLECCLNPQRMTPDVAVRTAIDFARARLGLHQLS